jgi:hypothetical protein
MPNWNEDEDEGPEESRERAKDGNHVAGKYKNFVQRCIVCGGILVDDRGACDPKGQAPAKGFVEGEVSVLGNMTSVGHDNNLESCKPL